jgi:hypothetical protein
MLSYPVPWRFPVLVMVRYNDNNLDIVEDYCLEYLIITGKVVEFSRSDEWIAVGVDPTRELSKTTQKLPYDGPERRKFTYRSSIVATS